MIKMLTKVQNLCSVVAKGRLPQNVPLWHVDYLELKTIEVQKTQAETLTPVTPQLPKRI